PQTFVVAQHAADVDDRLALHVEGDLTAVDGGLQDHRRVDARVGEGGKELVGERVEPAAVRALGRRRRVRGQAQSAVTGRVTAALHAEHATAFTARDDRTGGFGPTRLQAGTRPVRGRTRGARLRVGGRGSVGGLLWWWGGV